MINNDMMQGSRGQGVDHMQVRRLMAKVMFFFFVFCLFGYFPLIGVIQVYQIHL